MIDCYCQTWGGVWPKILLRSHHPNCMKFTWIEPVEHARELIQALADAMEAWAADEDGIHPDAWEAYKKAKSALMQPVADQSELTAAPMAESKPDGPR